MFDEIITNFYFINFLYILIIPLLAVLIICGFKNKYKIDIKDFVAIKNVNVILLLKYTFLSFIIRILLERLIVIFNLSLSNTQSSSNFIEIIITFVVSCIIASIFEEIIFRFGLYKKLNKNTNCFISMLLTSIIFAIIHFYNIDGFIILFGISLIWNYSFYKTNNLVYPILLHFIHNLYATTDILVNYSDYWSVLLFMNIIGYFIVIKK